MSIAEKLQTIADNMQRVYDAGKAEGGNTEEAYNQGYNDMLNLLTDGGARTWYGHLFRSCTSLIEPPYFDTSKGTNFGAMFSGCSSLKRIPQYDFSNATGANNDIFVHCPHLEELPIIDLKNATQTNFLFTNCSALRKIKKLNVSSSKSFGSTFLNCDKLSELTIEGDIAASISFANSSLLTSESVQSIVDALVTITDGVARTVTFHTDIQLTDEQKSTIEGKGWDLVQ